MLLSAAKWDPPAEPNDLIYMVQFLPVGAELMEWLCLQSDCVQLPLTDEKRTVRFYWSCWRNCLFHWLLPSEIRGSAHKDLTEKPVVGSFLDKTNVQLLITDTPNTRSIKSVGFLLKERRADGKLVEAEIHSWIMSCPQLSSGRDHHYNPVLLLLMI